MRLLLEVTSSMYDGLLRHLLPSGGEDEEAAFLFAHHVADTAAVRLIVKDSILLPPNAFAYRSPRYLELTDQTRGMLIKRAHELDAGLIEVHSHPKFSAEFSWSDKRGLREFVPHVWWRLKRRPYVALVVAPGGFDALAWVADPNAPQNLDALIVEGVPKYPTGLSLSRWDEEEEDGRASF